MTAQMNDKRPAAIRVVLPFAFRHWLNQPLLAAATAGGFVGATIADLFMPVFSGQLVDAMTFGRGGSRRAPCRVVAFGAIVALGLASMIVRLLGFRTIVPFTLRMMSDVARDAFMRVQRFSTDWHGNSFAGSTVRKITRGMWALDLLNDTIFMALLPSLLVLLGSMILLGLHWPSLGLVGRCGCGDLSADDRVVLDALHRAGRARLQCVGHQGRRHAGRCLDLQRGGQVVRRRGARGRAAGARRQPLAGARAADLAALQQHGAGAIVAAAVPARRRDRRRGAAVDRRARLARRRHLCA